MFTKKFIIIPLFINIQIEVLIAADKCENRVVETIQKSAFTGETGDGKICCYDIKHVVRIRTGETGPEAIRPSD